MNSLGEIRSRKERRRSFARLGLIGALCLVLVLGMSPPESALHASAAFQFNNVQVFIQTQSSGMGLYTLNAYNSSSDSLVSSTQSNYPAFSLELPSGTYLFSVTAVNISSSQYYSEYSTEEYGYQLVHVSASATLNIHTVPLEDIGSSKITIQAKYVNGTLISGAGVDASIVGLMYWWPYPVSYDSSSLVFYNQTDSSGTATLTVPSVPVVISAWKSVYVDLPANQTTVVKNIGGQNVNVTVYWAPMYVGLAGSVFVIPPSTSGEITLYAEQNPLYWYGGVVLLTGTAIVEGSTGASTATVASSPGLTPSSVYNQEQQVQENGNSGIAPSESSQSSESVQTIGIPETVQVNSDSSALTATDLVIAVSAIGALILAASSFSLMVLLRRKNSNVQERRDSSPTIV